MGYEADELHQFVIEQQEAARVEHAAERDAHRAEAQLRKEEQEREANLVQQKAVAKQAEMALQLQIEQAKKRSHRRHQVLVACLGLPVSVAQ